MKKPKKQAKENWHERKAKYEVFDSMFDDLPDGAYFAAMEEQGFDVEDHMEFSEQE